jgi:hypothetical protein
MGTEVYAVGLISVDGVPLMEEVSIDADLNPGNNIVVTQRKGFAGITPGAGRFSLKVNSAIPRAGIENGNLDLYDITKNHIPVSVVLTRGFKQLISKGFIMNISEKYSCNSDSVLDFAFEGEIPTER